jgi:hypothetical protein
MRGISFSMADTSAQGMVNALGGMSGRSSQSGYPNFFPHAQRDFAARMQWSVTPRHADANHAPVVRIDGPMHVIAYAGQKIKLSASVSDPDGNKVSVKWWTFDMPENKARLEIENPATLPTNVLIPKDAGRDTEFHLILEASDNGSPSLTRYQRVIITVKER